MKKYSACLVIAFLLMANAVWAGPGASGAQVLMQQNGARAAALGNAFAGCSGDITALEVNPAGAHNIEKNEIMLMHVGGFEGISTEKLNGVFLAPGLGTVSAQIIYRTQPVIDNHVAGEGTVNVKDIVYGLGWARSIAAGFSLGINAKILTMELGPAETSAISFDLGTQYEVNQAITVGLAIRNLGTPVIFAEEEDPLPMRVIAGTGYSIYNEGPHALQAALDLDYLVPEENTMVHAGLEYWFRRIFALRMGYEYSDQNTVDGFSAGIGFRFKAGKLDFVLDYTVRPQFWEKDDFEMENLFTLSVKF